MGVPAQAQTWFVATRAIRLDGLPTTGREYRVFSKSDFEKVGSEWELVPPSYDTEEEARQKADDLFWSEFS